MSDQEEIQQLRKCLEMAEAIIAGDSALIAGLRAEADELRQKLAECQEDAKRYQDWRENYGWSGASNDESAKGVDAAIVAAMKEEG